MGCGNGAAGAPAPALSVPMEPELPVAEAAAPVCLNFGRSSALCEVQEFACFRGTCRLVFKGCAGINSRKKRT